MAASRGMRRLLHVLELEEEHCRAGMEAALADLRRLEAALMAAGDQERAGRRLVTASAIAGEVADRMAGIEESRLALKRRVALKPRIEEAEVAAGARRQDFLEKRVARRQAETVVERADAEEAIEAGRRTQRALDDGFLRRVR